MQRGVIKLQAQFNIFLDVLRFAEMEGWHHVCHQLPSNSALPGSTWVSAGTETARPAPKARFGQDGGGSLPGLCTPISIFSMQIPGPARVSLWPVCCVNKTGRQRRARKSRPWLRTCALSNYLAAGPFDLQAAGWVFWVAAVNHRAPIFVCPRRCQ